MRHSPSLACRRPGAGSRARDGVLRRGGRAGRDRAHRRRARRARVPEGVGRAPAPLVDPQPAAHLRARLAGIQGRARGRPRRAAGQGRGDRCEHDPPRSPASSRSVRATSCGSSRPPVTWSSSNTAQMQVGNRMPKLNPPIGPEGLKGMAPPRIDHVFLMCEHINATTDFFRDVLGFRMTEQILADDGYQLASFLERSHSTHDVAFLTGPDGGFHHVAYWVDEWNDLRQRRRHVRLPRRHRRRRPHPSRRHARLRALLLRPGGQPQRALHRWLLVRPGRRADHVDRERDRPGDLLLPGQAEPGVHDGAFVSPALVRT